MAGFMYDDNRKSLLPANLEEQVCLKVNETFWKLELVNDIVGSGTFRHQPFGRQYGVGHMGDKCRPNGLIKLIN